MVKKIHAAPKNIKRPPTHPGEILREDVLPALRMSVAEAARRLGVSRQTLHGVMRPNNPKPITPGMALRIGRFCGDGPEIWLRLQISYDLWHAERAMAGKLAKIERQAA